MYWEIQEHILTGHTHNIKNPSVTVTPHTRWSLVANKSLGGITAWINKGFSGLGCSDKDNASNTNVIKLYIMYKRKQIHPGIYKI